MAGRNQGQTPCSRGSLAQDRLTVGMYLTLRRWVVFVVCSLGECFWGARQPSIFCTSFTNIGQTQPRKRGGQITHRAAAAPGNDLHTRPDENCLKLHRGRHRRDGLNSTRRVASDRRWGVASVLVLVRTDAIIATRMQVLPPGPDLG